MKRILVCVATVIAAMAVAPVYTQEPPAAAGTNGEETTLKAVMVTAQRETQNLQNVPLTVNDLTGKTLQQLSVLQFQDIATLVPGLDLSMSPTGFPQATVRGVDFVQVGEVSAVAFYQNDVPLYSNYAYDSLFDLADTEVLKGPQGTTFGVSAPSGAILLNTIRADTTEYGGYVETTQGNLDEHNYQGAVNIPVVKDVLGIRLAGVYDYNNAGGVTSINSNLAPWEELEAFRLSATFTPNDQVTAYLTWDHHIQYFDNFEPVTGAGPGAFSIGDTLFPASANPPLMPEDRLAVQDARNDRRAYRDLVTANVTTSVFGQRIRYIGSFYYDRSYTHDDSDISNEVPGVGLAAQSGYNHGIAQAMTQELRLGSKPDPARFFDYVVGGFFWRLDQSINDGLSESIFTPGAFGPTPVPDVSLFNPAYQIPIVYNYADDLGQSAVFGNFTLHLGSETDLSLGLRHMWLTDRNGTNVFLDNGLLSLPALGLSPATPCAVLGPGTIAAPTPGNCILPGGSAGNYDNYVSDTTTIYHVSLSHHLTPNIMLYATTGTAFRPPSTTVGLQGTLATSTDPSLRSLTFHSPESSTSYEVGIKTTFLQGLARVNASVFRQDFTNLVIERPSINYFNTLVDSTVVSNPMYQAVRARVQGFEVSGDFLITPRWIASVQGSYAKGTIEGDKTPCNIFGTNGQPVYNTDGVISLCSGGPTSLQPLWNATFQTQYTQPITDRLSSFVRATGVYYPANDQVEPGSDFVANGYSLVNLYAGVQDPTDGWQVTLFLKNAFNKVEVLDIGQTSPNINGDLSSFFPALIHPTNYYNAVMTPQREVGATIRYTFGSG